MFRESGSVTIKINYVKICCTVSTAHNVLEGLGLGRSLEGINPSRPVWLAKWLKLTNIDERTDYLLMLSVTMSANITSDFFSS